MSVMCHSDGKLTDKIYTDENLLGVETVIDVLPAFTEAPSQGASQKPVIGWHDVTPAVTIPALNGSLKPLKKKAKVTIWHRLAWVSRSQRVAGAAGLEPVTSAVTGQRSNQLSYAPAMGSVRLKN